MADADLLSLRGEKERALSLYTEAAVLEGEAFAATPTDLTRTRGILAISCVALYRKARRLDEAARAAFGFLIDRHMPEFARRELLDLAVEAEGHSAALSGGQILGREGFVISLRGGAVLPGGLVPLDTVAMKYEQLRNLAIRVGEWVRGVPFRERGAPSAELLQGIMPLVSAPTVGSHRFELRLQTGGQLELFGEEVADRIARHFYTLVDRAATEADLPTVEDPQYRSTFLHMIRNLAPNGKDLTEIEVRRSETAEATVLRPPVRRALDARIRRERKNARTQLPEETSRFGVLRALHLDQGWIILVEDGEEQKCFIGDEKVLDDVVGPLVNHDVEVTGRWESKNRFVLQDILEREDPSA